MDVPRLGGARRRPRSRRVFRDGGVILVGGAVVIPGMLWMPLWAAMNPMHGWDPEPFLQRFWLAPISVPTWALMWLIGFYPHVRMEDREVIVVNPFRTWTIPYSCISRIGGAGGDVIFELVDGRRVWSIALLGSVAAALTGRRSVHREFAERRKLANDGGPGQVRWRRTIGWRGVAAYLAYYALAGTIVHVAGAYSS